jgi:mRNA interferase HicA
MKRTDLVRHLEAHGCQLLREGANHSVYVSRATRKTSTVPRHREVNDFLAQKICKDLGIPTPSAKR